MAKSKIEWTECTWNPIVGCSKVSPGCDNCYAERMAWRLFNMGNRNYEQVVYQGGWSNTTLGVESALEKPLQWKTPRKIFVCSMSDLFHPSVPFEWIDKVFAVILANYLLANLGNSTFQILTKRAKRMLEYFTHRTPEQHIQAWAKIGNGHVTMKDEDVLFSEIVHAECYHHWDETGKAKDAYGEWIAVDNLFPLPNVWLGTTTENQKMVDKRILDLLKCPAAKRFVSVEPMLSGVNLNETRIGQVIGPCGECGEYKGACDCCMGIPSLDWVICGGESGSGARPMDPDWARGLRDQCADAGVPFFFKQWGKYFPRDQWEYSPELILPDDNVYETDGRTIILEGHKPMHPIGKKKAGCLLDGAEHKEMPEVGK